jgi:alpha-glucosidase
MEIGIDTRLSVHANARRTDGVHPAIFDPSSESSDINTTRAKQLAMYPVYLSGLRMVADTSQAYLDEGEVDPEFEFIENVPTSWHDTTVLNAAVSEYVTVARRNGEKRYVGSRTNRTARALDVPLSFLDEDSDSVAQVYTDRVAPCTNEAQTIVAIDEVIVDAADTIVASMIASGGRAIRLAPASADERTRPVRSGRREDDIGVEGAPNPVGHRVTAGPSAKDTLSPRTIAVDAEGGQCP